MDFIYCPRHPQSKVCYLYLLPDKVEILCDYCLEDNVIKSEILQINKLIHISALLKNPEILFKKLDIDGSIQGTLQINAKQNQHKINEQIKEAEKLIQDIQGQIQKNLEELGDHVKKLENLQSQFLEDIKQGLNFDQLKQLLMSLVQSNDVINLDTTEQLKISLHQYFQSLKGDNMKIINQLIIDKINQASNRVYEEIQKFLNIDQLKMKIDNFQNYYSLNFKANLIHYIFQLLTIQNNQFSLTKINERYFKNKTYYLGSRDGLNGQSFWQKVHGKKNCLMVFKSKSNFVFGGYSHCQWKYNLNNYVQDITNSSFLFSQTHDEVYPIKENLNQYAIYCARGFGFGTGNDMLIAPDFQDGHSKLGATYQWNQYQYQLSTHLFGQKTPNIMECEVFEITFK